MVQCVKDPALPQLWCRSQLQLRFDPWPGNFHMPWFHLKKKKKKVLQINKEHRVQLHGCRSSNYK